MAPVARWMHLQRCADLSARLVAGVDVETARRASSYGDGVTVERGHGARTSGYRGDDRRPVEDGAWGLHWFVGGGVVLLGCVMAAIVSAGPPRVVATVAHHAVTTQVVLAATLSVVAFAHHRVTGRAPEHGLGAAAILLALQAMATHLGLATGVLAALGVGAACLVGHAIWGPEVNAGGGLRTTYLAGGLGVATVLVVGSVLPEDLTGMSALLAAEVALWAFVAGLGFARVRVRGWGFLAWGAWMAIALAADAALRAVGLGWDMAVGSPLLVVVGLAIAALGGVHETARVATARRGDAHGLVLARHADSAAFETTMRAMRHEIRNAVIAIDGASMSMTLSGDRLSREDRERLRRTFQASLDGLRSLADPTPVVLTQTYRLDEVIAARADVASLRGIRVDAPWTAPIVVTGDRSPVARLIDNLILNAARHGEAGSDAHPVVIHVQEERRQARVLVTDDGPGVPAGDRARIFEASHRVHEDVPGDGLGLCVAREIAEGQGGEITYEARSGGGACFVLTLPLARRSAVPVRGPRRHEVEDG